MTVPSVSSSGLLSPATGASRLRGCHAAFAGTGGVGARRLWDRRARSWRYSSGWSAQYCAIDFDSRGGRAGGATFELSAVALPAGASAARAPEPAARANAKSTTAIRVGDKGSSRAQTARDAGFL